MAKLIDFLERNATGKKVLLLFIVANLIAAYMFLYSIPKLTEYSGGMEILDTKTTGYLTMYVRSLLSNLGEEGRSFYLYFQLLPDTIYPIIYGSAYSLMILYFLRKLRAKGRKVRYLAFIPLAAGLFDILENISIVSMILIQPVFSETLAKFTLAFTLLKSAASTVFFSALIILIVSFSVKKIIKKIKK